MQVKGARMMSMEKQHVLCHTLALCSSCGCRSICKPGLTDRGASDLCAAAEQMVCAYLMSTEGLSVSAAVDSVRAKRRVICPNIGFMQQLRLWEEMGCRLDDSNPQYRLAAHNT